MLGVSLKNLITGKEKKGLWDSFDDDRKQYHVDAFESLLRAQKKHKDDFDFDLWSQGYQDLDKHALKYFKTTQEGIDTQDDFEKSMNKTQVTVDSTKGRMERLSDGVNGALTRVGDAFTNIGTSLLDGFANAAVYATIIGTIKLLDVLHQTAQEKTEQAINSAANFETSRTELQSLDTQLQSIGTQIDALQAKGHLSFTDQTELSRLQAQSDELQRQLDIQTQLTTIQQEQAASDAADAFNTKSQQDATDTSGVGFWTDILDGIESAAAWVNDNLGFGMGPAGGSVGFLRGHNNGTPDEILSDRIDAAQAAQQTLKDLQDSLTEDNAESVKKQIDDQEQVVKNYNADLERLYNKYSQYTSSFFDPDTGKAITGYEEEAQRWADVQNKYLDYFGKNQQKSKDSLLNTIFAKSDFIGLEESLVEAGKMGENALDALINSTEGFPEALDEAGISVDELKEHIMSIADPDTMNFDTIKEQLTDAFSILDDDKVNEDRLAQFQNFLNGQSMADIEIFYKYINESGIDLSELTMPDVKELFLRVTADTSVAETSIEELAQKTNGVVSTISSIQSVLSSQTTGKSISSDIFSDATLKDYASALEYVNGCYKLNEEAVENLTQAKVQEQIATNDAKKALEQEEYLSNAAKIDVLRQKIAQNNFETGENAESIQAQINSLLESNSAIITNCNQLDVLNASLRESVGLYQQWIDRQNAGNSGDMFDDAATAWSQIRSIADQASEMFGRVGTQQYQASVDFIIPETVDHSDQQAVQKYLDGIKKYMSFDDDGNVNGINMQKFFSSAVDKGLMVETEDSYEMAGQMTMEKFAEGMNMSLPLVQAIFGEIDEFRPEGEEWFSWADEAVQSLGDLAVVASDSADALQATKQFANMDIKLDVSDLDNNAEKIAALDNTIAQMNQVKAAPEVDTSSIENANNIIQYCVQQKQALNEPAIMSVDTSLVEGQVGEAIVLLQQFHQAQNELEMQKALQLDTSEAENKVAGLTAQIQGINPQVTASLGIDPTSTETITSTLQGLTPELIVQAGVDDKAVIGYKPQNKEATVTYGVDHSAVDRYNPQNLKRTVTYSIVTTGSAPASQKKGSNNLNGNAHAYGTALAQGVWGAKQGGMSLVGELGREIIVNPYTGRWYTVGDNGAEFVNVPKHALVFNHIQSEELLKNGFVASRAQSYVNGTAFASGNAFVSGGIPKDHVTSKGNGKNSSSAAAKNSAKAAKNSAKAAKSAAKAAANSKEATENINDWLEIYLERLSHSLEELKNLADNYYTAYKKQNESLDKAIAQIKTNIKANQDGYAYYMQKAREVGLSGDYQSKIMSGQINIETITDENLQKQIDQFQEFYDKAMDCRDTIIDLNAEIRELSMQKIDNITNDYDSYIDVMDSIRNHYESYNDLLEAQGKDKSIEALKVQQDHANLSAKTRRAELEALRKEQDRLVSSGAILKWSEEWHMIEAQAHDIAAEIYKEEAAVYELRQEIREVQWKPFHDGLEALSNMNDNLESTLSLISDLEAFGKDSDALNMNGKLQLGLLTKQLGNARQSVAEYENAMNVLRDELQKGYLSEEQYKEEMQELTEGRNDAISSVKQYRDAILDLVKEGIEKETEAMQTLVDKRKEALQAQKDADDYAKSVRDKNTEINKIKSQIAALEGDDSASAKAKMRQLQEELRLAEQDLQDMQDDREYDLLQEGYDKAMDKFKETQDDELYNLNSNLDAQSQAIENILASAKNAYSLIFEELQKLSEVYGFTLSEELTNPWKNAEEALKAYQDATEKLDSKIDINTGVDDLEGGSHEVNYAESAPQQPDNNVQTQPPPSPPASSQGNIQVGSRINAGGALIYQSPGGRGARQYFRNDPIYTVLAEQNGWVKVRWHKTNSGVTGWFKKGDVKAYKTGGLVDYTGLAQLDGTPSKPEMVLNAKDTKNFMELKDILKRVASAGYLKQEFAVSNLRPDVKIMQPNLNNVAAPAMQQTIHFDNLINVEGNMTEEVLPKVQDMINTAILSHDKQTRINIANDFRKTGGRRR